MHVHTYKIKLLNPCPFKTRGQLILRVFFFKLLFLCNALKGQFHTNFAISLWGKNFTWLLIGKSDNGFATPCKRSHTDTE